MAQEPTQKKPGLLELLDELEKQGASDAEIADVARKYMRKKAREAGVPISGTFELTPLCNLDCKMCYVHLSDEQLRESDKRLLTVVEWKNIMQQAIDAGMISALLTGGETLLYPGFDELFLFLYNRGIEVYVKTNGLLMTDERIRFFKTHVPIAIQVSLYGSNDETYEKVTGHRCFEHVFRAISKAKDANLPIEVMITPNRYMLNDMEDLLIQVRKLGVTYFVGSGLFSPREETARTGETHDLTLDQYITLYKIQAKLNDRTLIPTCVDETNLHDRSQKPEYGLRCGGGRSNFAINWKGEMAPCTMLSEISVDLRKRSFNEAWREVNEAARSYPIPRECIGCTYQHLCPVCVVQHAYGAPLGHANPVFCERARRLIADGLYVMK